MPAMGINKVVLLAKSLFQQSDCIATVTGKLSMTRAASHVGVYARPESIMLQNLPIMLFGISLIFCLLCLFLCFLEMHYADNSYI